MNRKHRPRLAPLPAVQARALTLTAGANTSRLLTWHIRRKASPLCSISCKLLLPQPKCIDSVASHPDRIRAPVTCCRGTSISRRINRSAVCARNASRINSSKTKELNPSRINRSENQWEGCPLRVPKQLPPPRGTSLGCRGCGPGIQEPPSLRALAPETTRPQYSARPSTPRVDTARPRDIYGAGS